MLGKGDERPINAQDDRAAVLAALESVDLVEILNKVPLKAVELAHPDIYVKGATIASRIFPKPSWSLHGAQKQSQYSLNTNAQRLHF